MRITREGLSETVEIGMERGAHADHDPDRRGFLRRSLFTAGAVGTGAAAMQLGRAVALVSADSTGDIQMLQTAAAIENLAVKVYTAAAGLPPGVSGASNPVVLKFVQITIAQHTDHGRAFNAAAAQLGGKPQTGILQSVYDSVVTPALGKITGPAGVVSLAITLEDAAAQTYVKFGAAVDDTQAQKTFATVAPVEAQHVAVLLAVKALLDAGAPQLIALPPDLTKLPGPAGSVGFPKNFYPVTGAIAADAGAVK
jgi:rubrerythrin